jgi:transcription initiation factor TFIIIB Brf1 subunit/transcription initiation factor TFIIB
MAELGESTARLKINSVRERSIEEELSGYAQVHEEVRKKANEIYRRMNISNCRKNKRIRMLFYCCRCAYIELREEVNPEELAKIFGLKLGDATKAMNEFSPSVTGYNPPLKRTTCLDYIPRFCGKLGYDDETSKKVIALAKEVMKIDVKLKAKSPQTVASGIILYFFTINGKEVINELCKIVNRNPTTVRTMYDQISEAHNAVYNR